MARMSAISLGFLLMAIGCAGNPVSVELPLNHPADPGAYDSRFILPPDPFGTETTIAHPQGQDQSESAAGQRKSRGDLFESPAGQSATPGKGEKTKDRFPSGTSHQHHMEPGQ